MSNVVAALAYGTVAVQLSLLAGFLIFLGRKAGLELESRYPEELETLLKERYRELIFLQALAATSGSLYMSNLLGWTPCRLCWFQRIAIYPIAVIAGAALVLGKTDVEDYVMPLAMLGIPVSAYHYLVQRVSQFQSAGCSVFSVSCSTEYTFYLGYINISMMALTALVAILILSWKFNSTES